VVTGGKGGLEGKISGARSKGKKVADRQALGRQVEKTKKMGSSRVNRKKKAKKSDACERGERFGERATYRGVTGNESREEWRGAKTKRWGKGGVWRRDA